VTPFQFSDPASEDLAEAVRWYEQQRSGLGAQLLGAVSAAIEQIRAHPESGTPRPSRPTVRQVLVSRFPYSVVYQVRDGAVRVIAVAHTSRRPDYWRHRR
jgi:plasmid stabilization system protein ParE